MTKPVEVDPAAEDELVDAVRWHEYQREGLGEDLRQCAREALQRLRENPGHGGPVPWVDEALGVRRVLLERFPYLLIYREEATKIRVLAFAHTHRRPGYWRDRERPR